MSPPTADNPDGVEQRIEARRKLILDAFIAAGGEPADGRWTHVAQLSRLGVTRGGRRWLGTNVQRPTSHSDAQAKKSVQDDFLRQKVESWKQALTRDCVSGASGTSGAATEGHCDVQRPNASRRIRDTRSSSGVLNFKVTKRSAPSNAPPKPPKPAQPNLQPSPNGHTAFGPELSFLPPSFPSHLATSTPQHPPRRKPAPIPRVTVSSPCISPENVQVYDDTMPPPPYESLAPKLPVPSSSHTADSKTSAPLPTLTELLVTSKMKARERRMSQSTNSSPPRLTPRSGNRFNPAHDDAPRESVGLDARLRKARTTSLEFLDIHDPGGIEFEPPFTSTQVSAPINSHSSPTDRDLWRGYNSQFDVDRRTADVAKR